MKDNVSEVVDTTAEGYIHQETVSTVCDQIAKGLAEAAAGAAHVDGMVFISCLRSTEFASTTVISGNADALMHCTVALIEAVGRLVQADAAADGDLDDATKDMLASTPPGIVGLQHVTASIRQQIVDATENLRASMVEPTETVQ